VLRLGVRAALCATSALAFWSILSTQTVAGPCVVDTTASTVTCTGDPTLPVIYSDIATTTFSSLTTTLDPPSGTAIATITNAGAAGGASTQGGAGTAGAISYDSDSFGFTVDGASGFTMAVAGGAGGEGASGGGAGGQGGDADTAQITVTAPTAAIAGSGSAIAAMSTGGAGGGGNGQAPGENNVTGGPSGVGGFGGAASVTANIDTLTIAGGATGISVASAGGAGGSVSSDTWTQGDDDIVGSSGGDGREAGEASATLSLSQVVVSQASGAGVAVQSEGGAGGTGGLAISQEDFSQQLATGGAGGAGGAGSTATVDGSVVISGTTAAGFVGVLVESVGGAGGTGGEVSGGNGSSGGAGGAGGAGGEVWVGSTATFQFSADLTGDQTRALAAISHGGIGGDGGETQNSFGQKGKGGASAGGGDAGDVNVDLSGNATTAGASSDALFIQSVGGFAGSGPAATFGSGDESFGTGGDIDFAATLTQGANGYGLSTAGNASDALVAQSVGGGGGKALEGLALTGLGGSNMAGGDGGSVAVTLGGAPVLTTGAYSRGVYADSVGGGGGNGGASTGIVTIGAAGGSGGSGGTVSIESTSTVATSGDGSDGLFAGSRGGGGGSAMSAAGSFSVGGQAGGGGGAGGSATVDFSNGVSTAGDDADAITAQSVGGGGGDGANAVAAGIAYVQAIGGAGGEGGNAGGVGISQTIGPIVGTVQTTGSRSRGVVAQSVGGGGGHGGSAVAAGGGLAGYSHAVGGSGGDGGTGDTVTVDLVVAVGTQGDLSDAVFAQSVGGGGGAAGGVVNADVLGGIEVVHSVGGSGGSGGSAAAVSVATQGAVSAVGDHSAGIVAQAIGGGGGHSGIVIDNTTLDAAVIGVSVGGTGGSGGGVTGKVEVDASGAVSTQGVKAVGILAQSVGGGGGHGGTVISTTAATMASVNVDLGGTGGGGGDADDVKVTAGGSVSTAGDLSAAISAISTGGGGGSGGVAVDATTIAAGTVGVTIGGGGGTGASAGAVTVDASGAISTAGASSDGIYAASLGGFGGDAGIRLGSGATVNAATLGNVAITLGGKGGSGGAGGAVTVSSAGNVSTGGLFSAGIFAQSSGGGGGRARGTMAANVGDVGNVTVTLGGDGGTGGVAGDVSVTTTESATTIKTLGAFGHGMVAQSIGGAGGSGGFAAEASINVGTPQTEGASGQVGVTIGGGGAPGGRAGTVTVSNASAITTADFGSIGILAQTIGGNGGDGGSVYAGNLSANADASVNVDVDIGGDGGFGAEGNTVGLTNTATIITGGFLAPAILAQAIGGNGGNGGSTYTVLTQIGPGTPENIQVSVGGGGSGGGTGGAVTVTNGAALTTEKGGSDGIVAQSIGGGGGRGGSAGYIGINLTPPVKFDNDDLAVSVNVNVGAGGGGGGGGDAETVEVKNTGNITTSGTRSRGIFAQSIGGGGGDGGTASATSFALSDICNLGVEGKYICPASEDDDEEDDSIAINSTVQIGGSGAAGGAGDTVTVNNSGNITTSGQLSHGIYAQSIGGGGGNGGEGALGIEAWTTNNIAVNITDLPSNFLPSFSSNDVAVGGKGAGGGDGGAVSVTNSGTITILGPDASYLAKYTGVSGGIANELPFLAGGTAIFAQSVGGGGGDGGAGSSGLTATVTVGNGGGGAGDGGAVTVSSTGAITNSSGFSGTGIFAQSVGGGGGVAGDVGLGFSDSWEQLNIGAGIAISESPGDGGDGGTVSVTSNGAILTTGTASSGIVAQSVGGSGGIAAISSSNPKDTIYVGSGGAGGNGGDVTVTNGASITVQGAGSVGIVALSAGGVQSGDQSGTVTVNANADISATGQGGRGILVGSDSYQNQATGDVYVNIAEGATVSTGAQGAETIGVLAGGSETTLTNAGTITSGNASSYAIRATSENNFSIENTGTITGSILGTSVTEGGSQGMFGLNNYGTLNTGTEITLQGVTSSFYSEGTIAPGGGGIIASTTIGANEILELNISGTYQADFDPSRIVSGSVVAGDQLTLAGILNAAPDALIVNGTITPNVVLSSPGSALNSGSVYILASPGDYDTSGFVIANTATVQYGLAVSSTVQPNTNTLVLSYDIDTTPWSGPRSDLVPLEVRQRANTNHDSFGGYLDTLFFGGANPDTAAFVAALGATVLNTTDVDTLLDTYDGYVADEVLAVTDATYLASLMFSDQLFSCGRRDDRGVLRFGEEGTCGWARTYGRHIDVDQEKAGPSYTENVFGLAAGGQVEVASGTFFGFVGAWETGDIDLDGGDADVTRFLGGVSLKKDLGAVMLAGSLEGGFFSSDLSRSFVSGAQQLTATGDPDGYYLAAHLRASRRFETGAYFVEPTADFGLTWLRQRGYQESGAGGFNVNLASFEQTTFSFNPFVNFGGTFDIGGMPAELELRAGVLMLAGSDASVEASLAGAGGPTFTIENDQAKVFADLGARLEMQISESLSLRGDFESLLSKDHVAVGGGLRLNLAF
jgi:hypothetical protein